ncbi:hypothetical protein [Alcaligenes sp. Marseille-Q7550]
MISSGNLFSALSIFEAYILQLAIATEEVSGIEFSSVKGIGIEKIFNYFRRIGIAPEKIIMYEQIKSSQKIRNCLMHAGGMLQLSKEAEAIRAIIEKKAYLCEADRTRYKNNENPEIVSIGYYFIGEKVSIDKKYPHILCSYISRYIQVLGGEIMNWLEAQSA